MDDLDGASDADLVQLGINREEFALTGEESARPGLLEVAGLQRNPICLH